MMTKTLLHVGCGPLSRIRLHPVFHGPEWREIRLDIDPAAKVAHLNAAQRHPCLQEQAKYSALRFTIRITSPPLQRVPHYPKLHGVPMPLP